MIKTPRGIVVLDTEAPNLDAKPMAIGAVVYDYQTRAVTRSWVARCNPTETCSEWVQEHVLPILDDPQTGIPITLNTYHGLCHAWRQFYRDYHGTHEVLVHVGLPLETRLLEDAHNCQTAATMPYPLLDVATSLRDAGHDPRLVDSYLATHGIEVKGTPHHPLYEARATLQAWIHLAHTRHDAVLRAAWHPMMWRRRNQCPHQTMPGGTSTLETMHVDQGRKLWRCTQCGRHWTN